MKEEEIFRSLIYICTNERISPKVPQSKVLIIPRTLAFRIPWMMNCCTYEVLHIGKVTNDDVCFIFLLLISSSLTTTTTTMFVLHVCRFFLYLFFAFSFFEQTRKMINLHTQKEEKKWKTWFIQNSIHCRQMI